VFECHTFQRHVSQFLPSPYLVGELHLVPAGKIKSCLLPLHQKYAGLCNSALSDLSPCYQACHASQDSGSRVFCQEYGIQSPLMESYVQFLCQPWYHLSISSLCLSSISYSLLPYNILRLRPDVWRCLSVTSKKSPRWLWDFRNLSFLWKVFCEK
jgi:hypothetical protein